MLSISPLDVDSTNDRSAPVSPRSPSPHDALTASVTHSARPHAHLHRRNLVETAAVLRAVGDLLPHLRPPLSPPNAGDLLPHLTLPRDPRLRSARALTPRQPAAIENVRTKHPQLFYESKLYRILQGGTGIPNVKWFGVEGEALISF